MIRRARFSMTFEVKGEWNLVELTCEKISPVARRCDLSTEFKCGGMTKSKTWTMPGLLRCTNVEKMGDLIAFPEKTQSR